MRRYSRWVYAAAAIGLLIAGRRRLAAAGLAVLVLISLAAATSEASVPAPALADKLGLFPWGRGFSLLAPGAGPEPEQTDVGAQVSRTFTVNSDGTADDSIPGDGVCSTSTGVCTLRAAITEANATTESDTIHFAIPCFFFQGCVIPVITSTLPTITRPVTIDGTTQSPSLCDCVIVRGALNITGGNSTVRGLKIEATTPIKVTGPGGNNTIENNRIAGTGAGVSTSEAVLIMDSANNVIQNNTIINAAIGVRIWSTSTNAEAQFNATNNRVLGNTIGRAEAGSAASDANGVGVRIESNPFPAFGARSNVVQNNVISGNLSHGVESRASGPPATWCGATRSE